MLNWTGIAWRKRQSGVNGSVTRLGNRRDPFLAGGVEGIGRADCVFHRRLLFVRIEVVLIDLGIKRDGPLDARFLWELDRADEVAESVDVMVAAEDEFFVIVALDQRPDGARVLTANEGELLAIGFKQTAWTVAVGPTGVRIEVIGNERIRGSELVFGKLNRSVGHGGFPFTKKWAERPCPAQRLNYSFFSEATRRLIRPSRGTQSSWTLKPLPSLCCQAAPILVKNPLPPSRSRTW